MFALIVTKILILNYRNNILEQYFQLKGMDLLWTSSEYGFMQELAKGEVENK